MVTPLSSETTAAVLARVKAILGVTNADRDAELTQAVALANVVAESFLEYPVEGGPVVEHHTLGYGYGASQIIALNRRPKEMTAMFHGGQIVPLNGIVQVGAEITNVNRVEFGGGTYRIEYVAEGPEERPELIEAVAIIAADFTRRTGEGGDQFGRGPILSVDVPNLYRVTYRDPRGSGGGHGIPHEAAALLEPLKVWGP
jgi:hypothetical protein